MTEKTHPYLGGRFTLDSLSQAQRDVPRPVVIKLPAMSIARKFRGGRFDNTDLTSKKGQKP